MAYYCKYNEIELSSSDGFGVALDGFRVINISTSFLPLIENTSIGIWGRSGEIFNSCKDGIREITVEFIIKATNIEDYEDTKKSVKEAFNVKEPKPFYFENEDKFIFCKIDGEFIFEDIVKKDNKCLGKGEVTLIAYDPYFYSEEAKQFDSTEGETNIVCTNEGNVTAYPIIDIGFSKNAHFVQVENINNNKKILVGSYLTKGNTVVADKTEILNDTCEATTNWVVGSTNIDSDRAVGGTLSVTSAGAGIMAGNFGSKSTGATWYGTSARKNLASEVTDFYVECTMSHNSTGVNGDPTVGADDNETITTGTKTTYYKVTASTVNVRAGAGTKYKRLGSLKRNTKVYPTEISKGWATITYNSKTAYVSTSYLKKYVSDNTVTTSKKNYVTTESTSIRTTYKKTSTNLCTIPAGEVIRCIYNKQYLDPTDKNKKRYYYKLAEKYKGYEGYVAVSNLTEASNVAFEYAEEVETADDKLGMVELYGYTSAGVKLFKMGLYDDNPYYEFTYPLIQVGNTEFLKDNIISPMPNVNVEIKESEEKLTVSKDTLLSGKYGDWNEFTGKLGIQRENGKWKAWVYKIVDGQTVKQLLQNETDVEGSSTDKLAYVVAYFGTSADSSDKASGMSINQVTVKNINTKTYEENENVTIFEAGDTLKVDCYNNRVYLNDKPFNEYLDIGSQFFPLEVGENTIKVLSDDLAITSSIIYNERWL